MVRKIDYEELTEAVVARCMAQIEQFARRGFWTVEVDIWTRGIKETVQKRLEDLGYRTEKIWNGIRISWKET